MPRDAQLHRVLESGSGCPAALAILYMEVCARLGLPLGARVLDQGRYLVLWPIQADYSVNGQPCVIDAYSQGIPVLADEVCGISQLAWAALTHDVAIAVTQAAGKVCFACWLAGDHETWATW